MILFLLFLTAVVADTINQRNLVPHLQKLTQTALVNRAQWIQKMTDDMPTFDLETIILKKAVDTAKFGKTHFQLWWHLDPRFLLYEEGTGAIGEWAHRKEHQFKNVPEIMARVQELWRTQFCGAVSQWNVYSDLKLHVWKTEDEKAVVCGAWDPMGGGTCDGHEPMCAPRN